ncbi:MAG: hypothetical protein J0H54_08855 [Rhizobiales bacterium]|nr:hypothetical protein [Hyphomicrobiales bacterium]
MSHAEGGARRGLRHRVVAEVRLFLVLFIYLWLLLGLFVLNEGVVNRQHGDAFVFQGFALLNALVLAKIMMVAEHFDYSRWLRREPLILTILFEALVCTGLFLAFHIVERSLVAAWHGRPITADAISVGGGGLFGLAIVVIILFVSLLPFFAFKHVTRVIGRERMQQLLLSRRPLD